MNLSVQQCHYQPACTHVWVSVFALCDIQRLLAHPLPGGKHGYSLLFLLLFHIMPCFINTMVISLLLRLRFPCLSEWQWAQRASIDLRASRDAVPLSPFLPCQSFMNASGGEVAVGELQQTICVWTKVGNSRAMGATGCCITGLFFHDMLIKMPLCTCNQCLVRNRPWTEVGGGNVWFNCPSEAASTNFWTSVSLRHPELTFAGLYYLTPLSDHNSSFRSAAMMIDQQLNLKVNVMQTWAHTFPHKHTLSFLVVSFFPCISCSLVTCRRQPIKY